MKKVLIIPLLVGLLSIGALKSMELPTLNPQAETADLESNSSNNQNQICIGCNGFLSSGSLHRYPCNKHIVHASCSANMVECLRCARQPQEAQQGGWRNLLSSFGSKNNAKKPEQSVFELAQRADNLEKLLEDIRFNGMLNAGEINFQSNRLAQLGRDHAGLRQDYTASVELVTQWNEGQTLRANGLSDRIKSLETQVEELKDQKRILKYATIAASVVAGISLATSLYAIYSKPTPVLQYFGNNR